MPTVAPSWRAPSPRGQATGPGQTWRRWRRARRHAAIHFERRCYDENGGDEDSGDKDGSEMRIEQRKWEGRGTREGSDGLAYVRTRRKGSVYRVCGCERHK